MLVTLCTLFACSGDDYDDSKLWNQVNQNTEKISDLESAVAQLNSEISSLQTLVTNLNLGVMISDVSETSNGYKITFTDGTSVTLRNGKDGADGKDGTNGTDGTDGQDGKDGQDGADAPVIGVDVYDGVYYWTITVDGKTTWLTDADGNKLRVTGEDGAAANAGADGVTPLLRVSSDGYWEVSYDNGVTYQYVRDVDGKLVPASGSTQTTGSCIFKSVTVNADNVVFYLSNGNSFTIPREKEFAITFLEYDNIVIEQDSTKVLAFEVTGADNSTFVETCAHGNISATVNYKNGADAGSITVKRTGDMTDNTRLVVFLCNSKHTITKVLTFTEKRDPRIDNVIPEAIQDSIIDYIPIYPGVNPPNIEGCFVLDEPQVVHCSDVGNGGYADGETGFKDIYMRFSNQNATDNSLDFDRIEGTSTTTGTGAFISGSGNNFTAYFADTEGKTNGISMKTVTVISGTKTSSGIANLRWAFICTEKGSDPDNTVMKEGAYRVFRDKDELASPATWPGTDAKRRAQEKALHEVFDYCK